MMPWLGKESTGREAALLNPLGAGKAFAAV
jgi:hypothetical protein